MKIFIISYIISVGALLYPFLQDIMVRPFDTLPRLAFYLAFPLAVFISMVMILLGSYLGIHESSERIEQLVPHAPAEYNGLGEKRVA